jgi:LAO/AO transport system kinase
MVDFFLLIQLVGTGDELQGIKRGIMEMADGIIINKADGPNIERAKTARSLFQNALHLFPKPESNWDPQVLTCSSIEKTGIAEVWDMIINQQNYTKDNGYFEYKRSQQSKYWMYESINEKLKSHFYDNDDIESMLQLFEKKILNNEISSFVAAKELLDFYFGKKS